MVPCQVIDYHLTVDAAYFRERVRHCKILWFNFKFVVNSTIFMRLFMSFVLHFHSTDRTTRTSETQKRYNPIGERSRNFLHGKKNYRKKISRQNKKEGRKRRLVMNETIFSIYTRTHDTVSSRINNATELGRGFWDL